MEATDTDRKDGTRVTSLAVDVLAIARDLIERHEGSLRGAQLDSWSSAVLSELDGEWEAARRWRAAATVLAVLDSTLP